MHIVCPKCQAEYEIQYATNKISDALFICTSCRHEFSAGVHLFSEPEQADDVPKLIEQQSDNKIEDEIAEIRHIIPASLHPETAVLNDDRKPEKKWLWLQKTLLLLILVITILIAILIALSLSFESDESDYLESMKMDITSFLFNSVNTDTISPFVIAADSVHATWIRRDDDSQALLIRGTLNNHGLCPLPPPKILLVFTVQQQKETINKKNYLPVTKTPNETQLKHVPYKAPIRDTIPVAVQGKRDFSLLLEGIDATAGTFRLSTVASNRQRCL
ncbi:MAG: hypothetical protein R8K21_04375 [Mariprofundales bacterium]